MAEDWKNGNCKLFSYKPQTGVLFQYIAKILDSVIITSLSKRKREKMKVVKSFSFEDCNEFEVYNDNDVIVAYYVEYLKNPDTNEVLDNPVFEIYYDYNDEDDEYTSSIITEDYEEILDLIESL